MNGTKIYDVKETELEDLERLVPMLAFAACLQPDATADLRVASRRVKQILSDIRWEHGPPDRVENIEGAGP